MRIVLAAFAIGAVLGAGLVQTVVLLSAPPFQEEPDVRPPAIVAVEPAEGATLAAGGASFRITFDEPLAGSPEVTLVGPTNYTATEVSFDGLSWRGEAPIAAGSDGRHELRIEDVADANGNRPGTLSYVYSIDTTAPTAVASVVSAAASAPFDVSWDADDRNGSGISRTDLWWRADGGPWSLLMTSPDMRGIHRVDPGIRKATFDFAATAVDRAGNEEPGTLTAEATVAYNAVPPSASLLAVDVYWVRAPVDLTAIAGPNVTAVDLRYHFAPDNATWQGPFSAGTDAAPYAWRFDFPLGPGHYRLYARARDGEGTWESEQGPAVAETPLGYDVEPAASQLATVSPFWQSQPITVTAQATDDRSGVVRVELHYAYRQNGTAPWSPWIFVASLALPPWTFPFAFPRGDGRYALATRAVDGAGNGESLPPVASADVSIGSDRDIPAVPSFGVPTYIDPAPRLANVTWTDSPAPDVVRYEIHRGTTAAFAPDEGACGTGGTCVAETGPEARAAWASLPTENETYWFRVRAEDDGGLAATTPSAGAVFHGRGFDTANTYALATPLPVNVAWSERIDYAGGCGDCVDIFKISLNALDVLSLRLAVPATGDFRVLVLDASYAEVARSDVRAWGAWESLSVEVTKGGTYYVVVDWAGVGGAGRNEGWYTLGAIVSG